jgi:DNA-directed RNA polymerase specialized sigma24 family protein
MDCERLNSYPVEELAQACAEQASRPHASVDDPDPCYELFCCAFASSNHDAWQAILNQYRKLVSYWLDQHASEDAIQEVFLRFWKAQQSATSPFIARFPNIRTVMGYLKKCAITVHIEARRNEERQRILWDRLHDAALVESIITSARPNRENTGFDLKHLVLSKLKGEGEQVVFESMYYHNLTPREIQVERPDLFSDKRAVYRVKENLMKRLRRDPELQEYWVNRQR